MVEFHCMVCMPCESRPRSVIKALRDNPVVRQQYAEALEQHLPSLDSADENVDANALEI